MSTILCPSCGRENPEGFAFCGYCRASLDAGAAAPREVRKTVTIVFSDVTGSTAMGERLDPESLRRVMSRYFDTMRSVIERHGGTVEKFIGDAVMAVFGIPVLHEDDALRAVRAAWEMQSALAELNEGLEAERGVTIATRTGVNTGEVVAGDAASGQTLVTGDAVNTAARLEQAAAPGEILLGESTYRLVRDAVRVEPVTPLELKGKADPVPAHRLVEVLPDVMGHARRLDSPIVGRERELAQLVQAFDRTASERDPSLFTLLGTAGVGKSRLVQEFLDRVGDRATVLRGRCLPYGEGITYFPVAEAIHRALPGDGSLAEGIAAVVADGDRAEEIAERLGGILGEDADEAATPEEIAWGVRTLLEGMGRRRPIVVVLDDIHWGEATFLDLVDHVADWARDTSVLLLCVARPELLDIRQGWGGGKMNASTILLEPLSQDESAVLVANLLGTAELPAAIRSRITEAAEGNPLFVEEMLGMLIDEGHLRRDGEGWVPASDLATVAVPPTIQALLAARLDHLDISQREVLERASVVGQEFWRGAVVELSPETDQSGVPTNLMTLVRKELIRPGRSSFVGEDGFRFRHLLIRDAAYESMPKEMRAELHERFAVWLERVAGEGVSEFEPILGYHLEQAARYRLELGPGDRTSGALGERAATWLTAAAQRAFARGDNPAAANLFRRAVDLLEPETPARTALYPDLCTALWFVGDFERDIAALDAGLEESRLAGDLRTVRLLEVIAVLNRAQFDPSVRHGSILEVAASAIEYFETQGDDAALAFAYSRSGLALFWLGQAAKGWEQVSRAAEHARRAGDPRLELEVLRHGFGALTWGPMPVVEAVAWYEGMMSRVVGDHMQSGALQVHLGYLLAISGRADEAKDMVARGLADIGELGEGPLVASLRSQLAAMAHRALGDLEGAERLGREGIEALERMGETGYRSTAAAYLAEALLLRRDDAGAEEMLGIGTENTADDDFASQAVLGRVRARLLARMGEIDEALRTARDSVALTEGSDYIVEQADSHMALAAVLEAAGSPGEAAEEVALAVDRYRRKGATLLEKEALAELERLRTTAD
jgi:class 3 adenylate cyclase/tetratricopeptide (TPR) repeat protein